MQILNDSIIKDKYDVIVVGAGIGGITAGSLLAKKGLSVLLIEQHYLPGGVCTTVKRNGVSMDAGAALLFGWDTKVKGSPHVFVMNELEEEIDMINHEALYRMHFSGGRMVTFWKDFDRYFKELCVAFPGKEDQFKGFYDEAFRIYTSITSNVMVGTPDTMGKMDGLKMMIKNPKSVISMPKMMNSSLKDTLYKYVKDKEVEGLFDLLIASCYCTTIEETPLMLAAAIVCNTHDSGAYYPAGSPQMFPNKMEKAFEKYGGQILYRNLVDEILIENNTAVGVKLDNGTIIKSKTVVSNATIWNLYGKLIKPENTTPEKIEWAQSFIPSFGACVLYIGVKKDVIPEGTSSIEAFVNVRDLDAENYFMYIPSVDDPSICPEDMHSVSILCSAGDYNWPRPWEEGYQGEEYAKEKQKIADLALKKIEEHFPGFRKNIVTMEIGTPSTIERFTVRNHGCIGGPKQALGQHLLKRLKAKSEYKNLYCVGDSTVMGEGVVSVTSSAIGASNMLLKDLKMDQYKIRKYDKCYVNDVKGKPLAPLPALGVKLDESKAKRLANDCQWCEDPKCMTKCPAGIDVPNFVRRIEAGNFEGAARVIREMNPLGEICGLLCPAEKLCQSECNRLDFSENVTRIQDLQSWVCKTAGDKGWESNIPELNGKKIAVVGAGPAGMSCAYFLARLGYNIDVLEKDNKVGGTPASTIPSIRLSDSSLNRDMKGIEKLRNVNIKYGKALGKDVSIQDLSGEYDAVFMAPGLSSGRLLNLPGIEDEEIEVTDAISFLKSYKENGKVDIKGKILVIGGGSVAADAATVASKCGVEKVTMVCLESEKEMPCLKSELKELVEEGVEIFNSWGPKAISHASQAKLTCVCCTSVFDNQGGFCPDFDESKTKEIEFDHIIMAIGQQMESNLAQYLEKEFGKGLIKVNEDTQLIEGQSKVYAGGDIVRGAGTIVSAVADGRRAAMDIHNKLSK